MRNLTGRQIALVLAAVLAVATLAVGVYSLVRVPSSSAPASDPRREGAVEVAPEATAPVVSLDDRPLPHTTDPVAYTRAVATSLFAWDTAAGYLPIDYTAAVLADSDPSGEETPGLLDDVATYLPTVEQWLDLGAMNVVQSIDIEEVYVPDSWASAVAQAHGHLRPGTTALTIIGTRHRSGVWNGESAESSYPVSFTVFVACPPAFDRCRVLRLSQLDNPMK